MSQNPKSVADTVEQSKQFLDTLFTDNTHLQAAVIVFMWKDPSTNPTGVVHVEKVVQVDKPLISKLFTTINQFSFSLVMRLVKPLLTSDPPTKEGTGTN